MPRLGRLLILLVLHGVTVAAGNTTFPVDINSPARREPFIERRMQQGQPTGGSAIQFTLGMSISTASWGFDDSFQCFWCSDALAAATYWSTWVTERDIRTDGDRRLEVNVRKLEDFGNISQMVENYEILANRQGADKVDAFLGPAYGLGNTYVAKVAQKYKKILILWAFDEGDPSPYLQYPGPEVTPAQTVVPADLSLETLLSTEPGVPPKLPALSDLTGYYFDNSPYLFTHQSLYYGNYTVNVNFPLSSWAKEAIKLVYERGARRFKFINPGLYTYPFPTQPFYPDSLRLHDYAVGLPGTVCSIFNMSANVMADMSKLRSDTYDAVVFSGLLQDELLLIVNSKAFNLNAKAMIFDRPQGRLLVNTSKAYNVNYFMESFPITSTNYQDPIFRDRHEWVIRYRTSREFSDKIIEGQGIGNHGCNVPPSQCPTRLTGFASLQVTAAASLLTQALQKYGALDSTIRADGTSERTERIKESFRQDITETVMGRMRFDMNGYRIPFEGSVPSTRQFVPIAPPVGTSFTRFLDSYIKMVAESSDMEYPSMTYIQKAVQQYPCSVGCKIRSGGEEGCTPCPRGFYRGVDDLICRRCHHLPGRPSKFAPNIGMPACLEVAPGGVLQQDDPAELPVALKHFYPVQLSRVIVFEGSDRPPGESNDLIGCVDNNNIWLSTAFSACTPRTLCQGGNQVETCVGRNTGMLCGQCHPGETTSGPLVGMRRCRECSTSTTYLAIILVFLTFLVVGAAISQFAKASAQETSSLPCAVIRVGLHWCHCLEFALEGTSISADPIVAITSIPITVLCRPFEVMRLDCLLDDTSGLQTTKMFWEAAQLSVPIGLLLLILKPVLITIFRILKKTYFSQRRYRNTGNVRDDGHSKQIATNNSGHYISPEDWDAELHKNPYLHEGYPMNQDYKFNKRFGAGRTFVMQHEWFAFFEDVRTLLREFNIFLIMMQPVLLHSVKLVTSCKNMGKLGMSEKDSPARLRANYDVLCGSEEHDDLTQNCDLLQIIFISGMFAQIIVGLVTGRTDFFSEDWRSMFSFIFEGHRPDRIVWELWTMIRIVALYFICRYAQDMMNRAVAMACVFSASMIFLVWMEPFDMRDREILMSLEMKANVSIILTITVGMILQMELPESPESSAEFLSSGSSVPESWYPFLIILHLSGNCWFVANAFLALMYNCLGLKAAVFLQDSEFNVDNITKLMMRATKLARGMNPIGYYREGDRYFLDISRLDGSERHFLVTALIETLFACMDSTEHFQTLLLETAIREAFLRATQARAAKLSYAYSKYGTKPHYLLNFSIIRMFRVQLRPPDIPVEFDGTTHLDNGITVEEFHAALASVNIDILEHHPAFHRVDLDVNEEEHVEDTQGVCLTWNVGASLKTLEDDMQQQGTVSFFHDVPEDSVNATHALRLSTSMETLDGAMKQGTAPKDERSSFRRQKTPQQVEYGEGILDSMEWETYLQKGVQVNAKETVLEDELVAMEEEIQRLQKELSTVQDSIDISKLSEQQKNLLRLVQSGEAYIDSHEGHIDEVDAKLEEDMRSQFHRRLHYRKSSIQSVSKGTKPRLRQKSWTTIDPDSTTSQTPDRQIAFDPDTDEPQETLYRHDTPAKDLLSPKKRGA